MRSVPARPGGKAAPKKASGAAKKASPPKPAPFKKAVAAKATPPKPPKKKVSIKAPAKAAPKAAAKAPAKKAAVPAKPAAQVKPAAAPAEPAAPVKPAAAAKPAAAQAKPAAAKPPPLPPKPKPKKSNLTPKETEATRQELIAQRATLEKELEELDAGSLHVSQSELSGEVSYDEESADAGTFTFERERDLSLANNIRDLLDKVEHAMRRLNEGTYGVCERCGEPIDKARLKALPYSVLCIKCKQLEERFR